MFIGFFLDSVIAHHRIKHKIGQKGYDIMSKENNNNNQKNNQQQNNNQKNNQNNQNNKNED